MPSPAKLEKPPLASARASLAELLARDSVTKSMSPNKPKKRFGERDKELTKTN